jgi:hypothetical protein
MDASTIVRTSALLVCLVLCGCGSATTPPAVNLSGDSTNGPARIVAQFLEAVRTGDDKQAASLLTPLARSKTEEMEMVVAPPGSETAHYEVLDVQHVGEHVHVASHWTELDTDGLKHVDRVVWVLKQVPEGWRISGMTASAFSGAEPILLNFEDPADMLAKQQQAEEELARRSAQSLPAPQSRRSGSSPAVR